MGARASVEVKKALKLCRTRPVREAAHKFGVDASGLYKLLKKHGIKPLKK